MSNTTFSVPRAQFAEQLQIVARGLSSKSIIPTIDGILMESKDGGISLTATDLETQMCQRYERYCLHRSLAL
ncbi:MAG: hypothetical protein DDT34_02436 [Firmicutes bacterium]|nr:hypothetical protein [Bacillota bacterium]